MSTAAAGILFGVVALILFGVATYLEAHRPRRSLSPDPVIAAVKRLRVCTHPAASLRFDGAWDVACGLPLRRAGCATCLTCGTTITVALRQDVAEHYGYVVHGGPRGPASVDVMGATVAPDSTEMHATGGL